MDFFRIKHLNRDLHKESYYRDPRKLIERISYGTYVEKYKSRKIYEEESALDEAATGADYGIQEKR